MERVLGSTVLFVIGVTWFKRVERRYDEANFAEVYGCFDKLSEEEKIKVLRDLYEYKRSILNIVTKDTPYNLGVILRDIDFEDDSPMFERGLGYDFLKYNKL